jgi:uncharacterized protein (DUF2461 family)
MSMLTHEPLPLAPLVRVYCRAGVPSPEDLHRLAGLGPRFAAVLSATARFLYGDFLDRATDSELADAVLRFYDACVDPPLHRETLRQRIGIVRHAMAHLLRGRDAATAKIEACLDPAGPYQVPGLGPQFWSALLQGLRPTQNPGWMATILEGARRLGLSKLPPGAGAAAMYGTLLQAHRRIRALENSLSALHVDHFLTLVGTMRGRHLFPAEDTPVQDPLTAAIRRQRQPQPLRDLLKRRGPELAAAQERLEEGLRRCDGKLIGDALAVADPVGAGRSTLDWAAHGETLTLWVGRLWEADDPHPLLVAFWKVEPLPGAGLWLPAAVLHLRDPQRWQSWDEDARRGFAVLDDAPGGGASVAERYRLFNEGVAWLRSRHSLHPLEVPGILAALGEAESSARRPAAEADDDAGVVFGGFCADTFAFLGELAQNNTRPWMEQQRDRYHFAVSEPLLELCRALAGRYIRPVLSGQHGWRFDTAARPGRALTRISKNAYGRGGPYNTTLWIAFSEPSAGGARAAVQFFLRLDTDGVRYGLRIGRKARDAIRRFRRNVEQHGDLLFLALGQRGTIPACQFSTDDDSSAPHCLAAPADLVAWARGRSAAITRFQPAGAGILESEELVGEILLTFDRLVPLYACAAVEDAGEHLGRCVHGVARWTALDFHKATFLSGDWLRKAWGLLGLKKQLILQGPPGTGKTHVARCLGRLLTAGRDDAVRIVQFHPAYTYEEFVEGIRVRSVAVDGRHDVTYPVEDGLLCAFAAEAARHPADPYVLVIDEINRGNLPRIFGELLYLLEYRDQAIDLPCSRRRFRLPGNLYVIATMNAADRSVALVDQALRRRFSFIDMPPDPQVLAAWLAAHIPAAGPAFADSVLALFERLNARLRADLGPSAQVGHSYFMVDGLDETRLRIIWEHHIQPVLAEHFAARPERLADYTLDRLLDGALRRSRQQAALADAAG